MEHGRSGNTYKIVELVGSSPEGIEPAIEGALARAGETLRNLDWFEVREIRGALMDGKVGWYQVKLGVGFRIESHGDVSRE